MNYYTSANLNSTPSIDLVYLWCDGNEPSFKERRKQAKKKININLPEDNAGDIRYVENNELLYSLRSVNENIPWINHIFIVTDNQVPNWLSPHPLITVVDHKDIIPHELLPTFNAYVIETYLHRITGLSEHFIYANDDMFVMEPLNPDDFFDNAGFPIIRFAKSQSRLKKDAVKRLIVAENRTFLTTLQNAWLTFCEKNNTEIDFDTFDHSFAAYTKTSWQSVLRKYPEILTTNTSPFRTYQEIHRLLFSYEMAHVMNGKFTYINKPNFLNRLLSLFIDRNIWISCRQSIRKIARDIKVCHPKTVCVNQIDNKIQFNKLFNELFPKPAPWESPAKKNQDNKMHQSTPI